jgi:hypothetical protein
MGAVGSFNCSDPVVQVGPTCRSTEVIYKVQMYHMLKSTINDAMHISIRFNRI